MLGKDAKNSIWLNYSANATPFVISIFFSHPSFFGFQFKDRTRIFFLKVNFFLQRFVRYVTIKTNYFPSLKLLLKNPFWHKKSSLHDEPLFVKNDASFTRLLQKDYLALGDLRNFQAMLT